MWLKIFVIVCLVTTVTGRSCTKVNGVSGACNLNLNQFTFAGTHNSGAGAYGQMWYWSGVAVLTCHYHCQDKSIAQQLQLGIRYFDFDIAYITSSGPPEPTAKPAADAWWEAGIVLVHDTAYSRSLKRALLEIDSFLASHPDEVVVIRLKDHREYAREMIREHLAGELSVVTSTGLNPHRNPRLGDAIARNQRLVVFVNGAFWGVPDTHNLAQVESYENNGATEYCYSVDYVVKKLLSDARLTSKYYQVQVDWYFSYGLCVSHLAGLCDDAELYKLEQINKKIISATGRPVNLVMIDYAGAGNVRLADVVKNMNKYNIATFN